MNCDGAASATGLGRWVGRWNSGGGMERKLMNSDLCITIGAAV